MRKPAVLLLMLIIGMYACKHEVFKPDTTGTITDTTGTGGNPPPASSGSDSVCFEGDILPIFTSNCTQSGCHNAVDHEDGHILDSYINIMSNDHAIKPGNLDKSEIYERITETDVQKRMPLNKPPLSDTQIALIRRWILEGAKNTTNCSETCNAGVFTFSAAVKPIIDKNCKGCHSGSAPSGGLDYSNYNVIKTVALNGKLAGAINHAAGFSPMPKGSPKLSDCNISQITKWINAGAQNN